MEGDKLLQAKRYRSMTKACATRLSIKARRWKNFLRGDVYLTVRAP